MYSSTTVLQTSRWYMLRSWVDVPGVCSPDHSSSGLAWQAGTLATHGQGQRQPNEVEGSAGRLPLCSCCPMCSFTHVFNTPHVWLGEPMPQLSTLPADQPASQTCLSCVSDASSWSAGRVPATLRRTARFVGRVSCSVCGSACSSIQCYSRSRPIDEIVLQA